MHGETVKLINLPLLYPGAFPGRSPLPARVIFTEHLRQFPHKHSTLPTNFHTINTETNPTSRLFKISVLCLPSQHSLLSPHKVPKRLPVLYFKARLRYVVNFETLMDVHYMWQS